MAESFEPRAFTGRQPTVITISGDTVLSGYSLISVEFLQEGQPAPIAWSYSDFQVNQGQPTRAMLKSTPSAHFGDEEDTVSGTLTITLSGGGQEDILRVSEQVTVSQP
jgi:hypothetical protein